MAKKTTVNPQFDASVNRQTPAPAYTSGGNVEDAHSRILNIMGTMVDSQPQPFPTVPAGFNANHHFYPGLSRSYMFASVMETPTHTQVQYATQDIPSIQLTIRGPISPQVLQRWQLSQVSAVQITG